MKLLTRKVLSFIFNFTPLFSHFLPLKMVLYLSHVFKRPFPNVEDLQSCSNVCVGTEDVRAEQMFSPLHVAQLLC